MVHPVRHYQGAALLQAGHYAVAEAVYRVDLFHHPANGWALFGLARALKGQGKTSAARQAEAEFARVWARADIMLTTTGL